MPRQDMHLRRGVIDPGFRAAAGPKAGGTTPASGHDEESVAGPLLKGERMVAVADADFEGMSDLCIECCRAVLASGTPEMQMAARLLLETLARELVRREGTSAATEAAN